MLRRRGLLLVFVVVCFGGGGWLLPASRAMPLCTDSRPPVALNKTLAFCAYARGSSSCCDAAADATLQKQFDAFNVSDASCAALLKPILCAVPSSFPCFLLSSPHAHRGPRHTPVRRFASLEWITCSRFGLPCLFLFSYYTSTVLFIHVKKKTEILIIHH
ncbi:Os12g0639600 [Oryza sativa Japonica Group]|jgi:hypothetical protein|uniref:Os12g0639600 protein n=1 Tax=Oryza sativa subsp. japonica TaxID=39947 RepID=A0A0P0YCJ7_ORYSJ|nr:hypothetical protein EE612_061181 [Oryza sativa]BAT18291.1 Os12g0639600 [Oryza sativa Japonica Group]